MITSLVVLSSYYIFNVHLRTQFLRNIYANDWKVFILEENNDLQKLSHYVWSSRMDQGPVVLYKKLSNFNQAGG